MVEKFKENPIYLFILLGFLLLVGWFYWYEIRPTRIKADCGKKAGEYYERNFDNLDSDGDGKISAFQHEQINNARSEHYEACIQEKGL